MRKTLIVLTSLVFILAACLPGQSNADVQAAINTAVAQTLAAQNEINESVAMTVAAQNAANPSATPTTTETATPISFPTLTPAVPTVTPFTVNPPSGGGGSGSGAPAKANYACDIIRIRPTAYAEFNRNQDFDVRMTVVNQGTKSWYDGYDLKYTGGTVFTTVTHIELPPMDPGDQYEVVLDAQAPDKKGQHTMTWAVEGRICFGYITIVVK